MVAFSIKHRYEEISIELHLGPNGPRVEVITCEGETAPAQYVWLDREETVELATELLRLAKEMKEVG